MKNYRSMLIIIFLVLLTWQKSSGQYLLHGYTPDIFPSDTVVNVGGENVIAQWFVTPVNGTIEYVYLMIGDTITAVDSIGFLRIHRSNISPGRGPGFDYPSPPVKWGGYKNTNVSDSTFAAFIENATDTHWISTVPYEIPSFPPWGDELWGFGGYPLILRPTMISVDVRFFFYPYVQRGEAFVVSIRVKGGQNTSGYPTQFLASKTHDTLSRAWIFYPNDSGWQALGKLNFNIWVGISTGDNFNRITYPKGWNMLCVPKDVTDKRKTIIFLCAGSDAYGYNNGYSTFDTLHNGKGYWIKFDSPCAADFRGEYLFEESTEVRTGWNLIGTPSIEIPLEHVYSFPEGNISSGFYRYNSGYLLSDVLSVGNGYWVKVNEDGIILLS
ncbi:MAG: hypothetical protein HYZ34_11800, partial [Ignavibacteriae bacterium]|nr:hypothetical protein [Ignavibacteriota bacterium]